MSPAKARLLGKGHRVLSVASFDLQADWRVLYLLRMCRQDWRTVGRILRLGIWNLLHHQPVRVWGGRHPELHPPPEHGISLGLRRVRHLSLQAKQA